MTKFSQIKTPSTKTAQITLCAVMYALLALFIIGLLVFSAYYPQIYDCPEVKNGKADFTQTDLPSRDVACNLAGEWEFFYNKWIVTDEYSGEADGLLKLPNVWTYKNFGNGALPRTGYASYRLTAYNVQPDTNVIVYRHYSNFAYRVFINGQLNYRSGTLSKNVKETVVTGRTDQQIPYRTDGSPLEIVIEISATNAGGFNGAPWIAATSTGNSYGSNLRAFNYIALGITTAAVAVSIITCFFFKFKRDITVPLFMIALYAHFLSSKDMLFVFKLQITASMILGLISGITALVLLIAHCIRCGAVVSKLHLIISSALSAVCIALLFAFYGTPVAPVCAFLLLAACCSYLVPIALNKKFGLPKRIVYCFLFAFLMSVFFFETCDALGLIVFGTEFIFTVELMLIIACFTALWLWKLTETAREAIRASNLECELATVKSKALMAQIKPHFVYNSLTSIQAQYRKSLDEGDKAITQFAKHLRLVTDSDVQNVIPFEDEIRNVLNYFELENLRANGTLELLLDLNYTEFCVPVLSLQPLVENAVQHGGLKQEKNKFVQLTSAKTDNAIVISVKDNGNGFDTTTTREGVGLTNTRKRLELVGATVNVQSEPNEGTEITIKIPLESNL